MSEYMGWIVRATAGHDKGTVFCVVGVDRQQLLLANGKQRKLHAPKKKQMGHVETLSCGAFEHPVLTALRQGKPVSDKALRGALAAFKGGNHAWLKTI